MSAFTPQIQSIIALWLVLITCPTEGRRLSWPGWAVMRSGAMAHICVQSYISTVLSSQRAQCQSIHTSRALAHLFYRTVKLTASNNQQLTKSTQLAD